jgi:hypothetical protein
MQALLSLSFPCVICGSTIGPFTIAEPQHHLTTLGHFTSFLVDVLAEAQQESGEQRDQHAQICDLRFIRRLMIYGRRYGYIFTPNSFSLPAYLKTSPTAMPPS